jgi:hypothetical protein
MYKKPTLSVELITPELAQQYLDEQAHNRIPDLNRVSKYSNRILNEEWGLGAALEFDEDNKLFNGAHRLLAVIHSSVPTKFLVVRGVRK